MFFFLLFCNVLLLKATQSFVVLPVPARCARLAHAVDECTRRRQLTSNLGCSDLGEADERDVTRAGVREDNAGPSLALNKSAIAALAESGTPVGAFQIARPRWYNKAEVAIILLLVQRLRILDVRGVEHMLEATDDFRDQDPRDVMERALFLIEAAPGANFRTVIQRHPRTLLVPVWKMKRVCEVISHAYPGANIARVIERIPSVFSRDITKLERNLAGLQKHVPEIDSAIFQAAPSMAFLPPKTVKDKVASLRYHLPGMNLRNFLKGMPTALARSRQTVPRGLSEVRKRFPTASNKELVRIIESAPSLVRMSGANGSLDIKVDALMTLLPGVNVTNVISNAPGVLVRSSASLPSKVEKLATIFPSANVTKMVSRTPGILYLDMDRTVRPKALWIKQAVGLEQDELDRLIEQGPWLLKAGWGPLARLEFAIEAGIARKERPASLLGLVRHSRAAFAAAHSPVYGEFLEKRLDEEGTGEAWKAGGVHDEGGDPERPRAWGRRSAVSSIDVNDGGEPASPKNSKSAAMARADESGRAGGHGLDAGHDESLPGEDVAVEVGQLEDALARSRKSRLGGVKERPPRLRPEALVRLQGSPQDGDAFLDLDRDAIARRETRLAP